MNIMSALISLILYCVFFNASYAKTNTQGTEAILAAITQGDTVSSHIILSTDQGKTWVPQNIIFPKKTDLAAIHCFGKADAATCIAVGSTPEKKPVIVVTKNRGKTWELKSIQNYPPIISYGFLKNIHCSENGPNTLCVAVGSAFLQPLIAVSKDGGNNWEYKSITNYPSPSANFPNTLDSVSCTDKNNNAVCVAVGGRNSLAMQGEFPILVASGDGGNTWERKNIFSEFQLGALLSTSCTGEGNGVVCTAVGEFQKLYPHSGLVESPVIASSQDRGNSWTLRSIPEYLGDSGQIYSVSCIGNGKTARCSASGSGNNTYLTSQDAGLTWGDNYFSIGRSFGASGVSCIGSEMKNICMTGINDQIYIYTDGEENHQPLLNHTKNYTYYFYPMSCTGDGSSTNSICMVATPLKDGLTPAIVISTDGGQNWETKVFPNETAIIGLSASG